MRFLIRSVLGLVLLIAVLVAGLFMVPADRVARIAADKFTAATGRSLSIEGPVRASLWPRLAVTTGPITIANADWSDAGPLLTAQALDIGVDMATLFGGAVKITGITVDAPRILLERARDGRENWVFDALAPSATANPDTANGTEFSLELAKITDGALSYIDHGSDSRITLGAVNGTASIPNVRAAADITLSATMNDQPAEISLEIAQFEPFLAGQVVGVDLRLRAGGADIAFAGRAGFSPPEATGALNADLGDLTAISRLAGMATPVLPQGLGAGSVAVQGDLTLTAKGNAHLRKATATLDTTRLAFEADLVSGGPRPKLSAQVQAGALRLVLPGSDAQAAGVGDGWSTAAIDVSALGMMDANIALSADSIDLGGIKLGTTRLVMALDRARAVFDLAQVGAYQGGVTGQFVVNGRGGLSLGGDLRATAIAMQPLLQDLAGYDRLIGTANLELKFLAVGNSTDALMRGLSGSGSASFGKGELRGLDLAGMLRNLDPGYVGAGQKTIFDTIGGTFSIDKGTLTNNDLVLKAPYVTASGAGTVGIGARRLDYRLVPTALAATDGTGGVKVPLLITGPWANLSYRLDLESLARERLDAEAAALEARAKAELEARAASELGVVRQEGESLEDAAKRRAQEALEAETGRLLERLLGGN